VPEHSGSGDISRSLALMWRFGERSGPGPKPQLTLEQIVERAVAVADAEGLEAVSMRRVASDLGVGTMSLYRYLPGKEELLDLMLEHVSDPGTDQLPAGWRAALEQVGRGCWEMYTRHPWLPFVDQTRPLLGPNALRGLEVALEALAGSRPTDQQKVLILTTLDTFAAGAARAHNAGLLAESRTGVSNDDFWAAQAPILTEAMADGAFPRMAALAPDAWGADGLQAFEFGLRLLLDGMAPLFDGEK